MLIGSDFLNLLLLIVHPNMHKPRNIDYNGHFDQSNIIQLSPEGEVNSGGYIPRREASRYISTALHRP